MCIRDRLLTVPITYVHFYFTYPKCKSVAIIMDETTDITNRPTCQVSTVFRYVDKATAVQERFIGFSDFSDDRTADVLANLSLIHI